MKGYYNLFRKFFVVLSVVEGLILKGYYNNSFL